VITKRAGDYLTILISTITIYEGFSLKGFVKSKAELRILRVYIWSSNLTIRKVQSYDY